MNHVMPLRMRGAATSGRPASCCFHYRASVGSPTRSMRMVPKQVTLRSES